MNSRQTQKKTVGYCLTVVTSWDVFHWMYLVRSDSTASCRHCPRWSVGLWSVWAIRVNSSHMVLEPSRGNDMEYYPGKEWQSGSMKRGNVWNKMRPFHLEQCSTGITPPTCTVSWTWCRVDHMVCCSFFFPSWAEANLPLQPICSEVQKVVQSVMPHRAVVWVLFCLLAWVNILWP